MDSHQDEPVTGSGFLETSLDSATTPFSIAIDVGSSSARTFVFDHRGRTILGLAAQIGYEARSGEEGQSTYDPNALLQSTIRCSTQLWRLGHGD